MTTLTEQELQTTTGGITKNWFLKMEEASAKAYAKAHPEKRWAASDRRWQWMELCMKYLPLCDRHPTEGLRRSLVPMFPPGGPVGPFPPAGP